MDFAKIAQQLGGTPVGSQPTQTPIANAGTAQNVNRSDFGSIATQLGGQPLGSKQSDTPHPSFVKQVGDFFTGNTQQFGHTVGEAIAAPHNAELYNEAIGSHTDITNNLLKTIKAKQAIGQDTSKLQEVLNEHIATTPKLEDFTGNSINLSNEQVIGQAAGVGLEALQGGLLSNGASTLGNKALSTGGKILQSAGSGAAYGALGGLSSGMQQNKDLSGLAQSTGTGAALGGALGGTGSAIMEGLNSLATKLPSRIVRNAIPGTDQKLAEYALENKPIGKLNTLITDSQKSTANLGTQIDTIIQHPEYENIKVGTPSVMENGGVMVGDNGIIKNTLAAFPNSEYSDKDVVNAIKTLVPEQAKLVDKVASGDATLIEANNLKKAIYPKVQKVFTDSSSPNIAAIKKIGAEFSTAIADKIKTAVPETQPIFEKLSKEIQLRNLLLKLGKKVDAQKTIGIYDLGTIAAFGNIGGVPGAIAAETGKKIASSPATKFAVAKGINSLQKAGNSASGQSIRKVGTALRNKIITKVSN